MEIFLEREVFLYGQREAGNILGIEAKSSEILIRTDGRGRKSRNRGEEPGNIYIKRRKRLEISLRRETNSQGIFTWTEGRGRKYFWKEREGGNIKSEETFWKERGREILI